MTTRRSRPALALALTLLLLVEPLAASTKPQLKSVSTASQQYCDAQASSWYLSLRGGASPPCPRVPIKEWHPVLLAFLGTSFGWLMTALGSASVIVHRLDLPEATYRKVLDFMLGVSGGVMMAASYWSLLAPALEFAELQGWGDFSYAPVALGFLSGGAILQGTDWWLTKVQGSLEELDLYRDVAAGPKVIHYDEPLKKGKSKRSTSPAKPRSSSSSPSSKAVSSSSSKEGPGRVTKLRRLLMLIIAITIHNFPEGMAVGVAFGAIGSAPGATFGSAASLALGIGIQNFPVRAEMQQQHTSQSMHTRAQKSRFNSLLMLASLLACRRRASPSPCRSCARASPLSNPSGTAN